MCTVKPSLHLHFNENISEENKVPKKRKKGRRGRGKGRGQKGDGPWNDANEPGNYWGVQDQGHWDDGSEGQGHWDYDEAGGQGDWDYGEEQGEGYDQEQGQWEYGEGQGHYEEQLNQNDYERSGEYEQWNHPGHSSEYEQWNNPAEPSACEQWNNPAHSSEYEQLAYHPAEPSGYEQWACKPMHINDTQPAPWSFQAQMARYRPQIQPSAGYGNPMRGPNPYAPPFLPVRPGAGRKILRGRHQAGLRLRFRPY